MRYLFLFIGVFHGGLFAESAPIRSVGDKPNIVLIVADDLGYGELSCQGNGEIPTPHIDSIASGGVRFTQGYVTAPFCSASRAGMMTGRYQTRFGYEFNPTGAKNEEPNAGLPVGERTLADELVEAGYVTGLSGSGISGVPRNSIRSGGVLMSSSGFSTRGIISCRRPMWERRPGCGGRSSLEAERVDGLRPTGR